jgi:glyoxylase-like metal-dependent hydrolase (beta-lactamase superfamily II)
VLLWDGQFHAADARRVADAIKATGKRLKAIVLSHPDEDHVSGLAAIVERFPGTPVYVSSAGMKAWPAAEKRFKSDRARMGAVLPDSLATPTLLPSNKLSVDGVSVEVIPDLTGDIITPSNSILWIPSQRTVLAGDIIFNNVHAWLGSSDSASRVAWRASLRRIASLNPTVVIAGHKKDIRAADTPDQVERMLRYLDDFEALVKTSTTAAEVRSGMIAKYPDHAQRGLIGSGASSAMQQKARAAAPAAAATANVPLRTGKWSGTLTLPDGTVMKPMFDIAVSAGAMTIDISADGRTIPAADIKSDGTNLSFRFQPGPMIPCTLKKREDGAYAGTCSFGATDGPIVLLPPRDGG